jgi:hypothetical protein
VHDLPSTGPVLADGEGGAQADHLPHRIAHLDLDGLTLARHLHVGAAQLAEKIQRRPGLLVQRQTQRVIPTALAKRLVHIIGKTIESVGRTSPFDPLVRALVIVIVDPVIAPLTGIGEGGEDRLAQKLPPQRLPEALDLAQGLRMVRSATDMSDPLLLEHPLKARLAAPGHELAPVVGEDLPRGAPLAEGSF